MRRRPLIRFCVVVLLLLKEKVGGSLSLLDFSHSKNSHALSILTQKFSLKKCVWGDCLFRVIHAFFNPLYGKQNAK